MIQETRSQGGFPENRFSSSRSYAIEHYEMLYQKKETDFSDAAFCATVYADLALFLLI